MAGWIFVVLVGLMLPASALKQFFKPRLGPNPDDPALRAKLVKQTILMMAFFGVLAILVADKERIRLFGPYVFREIDVLAGTVLFLTSFLMRAALLGWLAGDPRRKPSLIAPKSWAQFPLWIVVSASAGFWEEIIYRGALFHILVNLTNSIPFAFVFTSLAFASVHLRRGLRSGLFILVFASAVQWLVAFTGTLYIAMVVHFVYDVLVGVTVILAEQRKSEVSE